jgi:hypothetical protein
VKFPFFHFKFFFVSSVGFISEAKEFLHTEITMRYLFPLL